MPARKWTVEQDALVRQFFCNDGLTTAAMGLHFGVDRSTVERRIRFLQLTRPWLRPQRGGWSEERDVQLTRLWDDKTLSATEIGERMHISKNAVVGRVHRLHLPPRPNPIVKANYYHPRSPWPERDDQLRQLWGAGHSSREIGRLMSLTKNTILGRAHRIKLPSRPSPLHPHGSGNLPRAPRRPPVMKLATLESLRTPMLVQLTPPTPEPVGRVVPCSYPLGEVGTRSFRYCDEPSRPNSSYCLEHHRLCHVRTREYEDVA